MTTPESVKVIDAKSVYFGEEDSLYVVGRVQVRGVESEVGQVEVDSVEQRRLRDGRCRHQEDADQSETTGLARDAHGSLQQFN